MLCTALAACQKAQGISGSAEDLSLESTLEVPTGSHASSSPSSACSACSSDH